MKTALPLLVVPALLGAPAAAQGLQPASPVKRPGFPPGTVAVVTSDGFFVPDRQGPVPHVFVADADFPGAPDFVRPAVQWEPGTSAFLVTSGAALFRVTVDSLEGGGFTIDDLTPQTAAPMNLYDLDVNPGTGELFLLDQTTKTVERYQAPYFPGMVSDLTVPVPNTTRSIAIDSRAIPPALLAGETSQVTRVFLDGSTADVSYMLFPTGVDQDPQYTGQQGTYMCSGDDDIGLATNSPNLLVGMNYLGVCLPLAYGPEDVEWDAVSQRAFVLAEDGTNQLWCPGFTNGPNHVVEFPKAQVPGVVQPKPYTYPPDSGITGTNGDLAVAHDDFAFVTPYGSGCAGGAAGTMTLDVGQLPVAGLATLTVRLSGAPPATPATLVVGFSRAAGPLAGGCTLLASPDVLLPLGTTDAAGYVELDIAMPATQAGTDLWLQGAVDLGGTWSVSQGLLVHIGQK